jgi:hypothetical protein
MAEISKRLRHELYVARARRVPQYAIAKRAGVNGSVLSALLNGQKTTRDEDERVIRVGAVLGLSAADCFEHEDGR